MGSGVTGQGSGVRVHIPEAGMGTTQAPPFFWFQKYKVQKQMHPHKDASELHSIILRTGKHTGTSAHIGQNETKIKSVSGARHEYKKSPSNFFVLEIESSKAEAYTQRCK